MAVFLLSLGIISNLEHHTAKCIGPVLAASFSKQHVTGRRRYDFSCCFGLLLCLGEDATGLFPEPMIVVWIFVGRVCNITFASLHDDC